MVKIKIQDLENKIDLFFLIAKDYELKNVGAEKYRVDPCPICGSKEHFTVYKETNSYSSFSECCKGGGPYKYLQEVKGFSEDEAYKQLCILAGEPDNKKDVTPKPTKAEVTPSQKNYTNVINKLYNEQSTEDKDYFISRGLTHTIIEKYKLCVGDIKELDAKCYGRRAIIPIFKDGQVVFYNARAIDPKGEAFTKYLKAVGKATFFNIDYLKTVAKGEVIAVTEGEFDALSLESIGVKSIAIGGVENYNKFLEQNTRKDILFLTAFDNDKAGQERQSEYFISIPKKYKDLNEWLNDDKSDFKACVNSQVEIYQKEFKERLQGEYDANMDITSNYLRDNFSKDIDKFRNYKNMKTGFDNLDNIIHSLYPGLYVIGGISSVGKTTFIHQMGDQMAKLGNHILYFSLEQSRFEMVSKSLARITAQNDMGNALTSVEIRGGKQVNRAIEQYTEIANRVSIIEGNFNTTVDTISDYVKAYIQENKVKPIVIADYLQIIQSSDARLSDKQKIDSIVTSLKRMSRDNELIVFVISSLNRSNYLSPVDFESFKESGGIEYTADVVWGLQLNAINEELFEASNKIIDKRNRIKQAKLETPRKIQLQCLKNRFGVSSYSVVFDYYSQYDLYKPESDFESIAENENPFSITIDYNKAYPQRRI